MAFHMDTETRFTESESPIQIQCTQVYDPHCTQAMRIVLLDWISRTVTQHCSRQSGLWFHIPDLHQIWIQGPVWRTPILSQLLYETLIS